MDDVILRSVIDNGMKSLLNHSASRRVRRDVIETIRRKSISLLSRPESILDSDPSVANRARYEGKSSLLDTEKPTSEESLPEEDEFADEFSDGEMVHSSEAARKLATTAVKQPEVPSEKVKPPTQAVPRKIESAEQLSDSLEDAEYDAIGEPSDCDIRVYGQTEVCDSGEGARKSESRWVVTVLNGFIRCETSDEEILFRTSNLTRPHIHQS
jgi:hypothetical protein